MDDILKSIKAFFYERAASPLLGAYVTAWSLWNYRTITILISGESIDKKFSVIDKLYEPFSYTINNCQFSIYGGLFHGVFIPVLVTISYIYIYPLIAIPVYEHSLKKQQKLREAKQKEENNRLLSIKESRELYKKIAMLEVKIDEDTESYRKQIKSLTETIDTFENSNPITSSNKFDDINNAEPEEFDRHIEEQIQSLPEGDFQLVNLFSDDSWSELSAPKKQTIGKRLKKLVERGDFINISVKGKGSGNQIIYNKSFQNKAMPQSVVEQDISEPEITLLKFIEKEGVFGPPDNMSLSNATRAGKVLEEKGMIESDQDGMHLTRLGLEWVTRKK